MGRLRVWAARLKGGLRPRTGDERLAEELQAHLDLLADDYVARGMTREDARLAARKAFGGLDQMKERYRDQRGLPALDGLLQDVRAAGRLFARDRWLTTATVAALAIGMAGSATMFSLIYSMNFRELPFEDPAELVAVRGEPNRAQRALVPFAIFQAWQTASTTLAAMAAHVGSPINLGDETHATDQLSGMFIGHNTFAILRVRPSIGRDFRPDDDRPGAPRVAIVGYRVWTDRYGSDPAIVGRSVRANGQAATIVGVMPEGFMYPVDTEIWMPLAALPAMSTPAAGKQLVHILARLADGVSSEQTRGELAAISSTLTTVSETDRTRPPVVLPLNEAYFGAAFQTTPVMMIAATFVVLLIACSHAASLLVARAAARSREMAMRTALGASRGRIIRQLLIESTLMALAAGLLAIIMASFGMRLFANETVGAGIPYWTRFTLDMRLFTALAILSGLVGIAFGLVPALQISRGTAWATLKGRPYKTCGGNPSGLPGTSVLLVGEMAMTVVLLASAGTLVQSANVVYQADRTMDLDNLWEYRLSLPQPRYATSEQRLAFYRRLDDRLAEAPGMDSAALAGSTPFLAREERGIVMGNGPAPADVQLPTAHVVSIGSRYFETLGLRLIAGRRFEDLEPAALATSALVNQRFVERFSPSDDPVGREVLIVNERAPGSAPLHVTVVGIAPPMRQALNAAQTPVLYLPHAVEPAATASIIIRGQPDRFAALLRQEVRRLDPDLPLFRLQSLERASYLSRWIPRITSTAFSVTAVLATLLSALGLYSITAFAASQRTREIGIRMALGATRFQVSWLFLRRVLLQVAVSLTIGLAGAAAAGTALQALLVDVRAGSFLLLLQVSALLVAVSVAACLVPARRAARVDPVVALRHD